MINLENIFTLHYGLMERGVIIPKLGSLNIRRLRKFITLNSNSIKLSRQHFRFWVGMLSVIVPSGFREGTVLCALLQSRRAYVPNLLRFGKSLP